MPNGFEIAGTDNKFYLVDAEVIGDEVVLSTPMVSTPVAVRYGYRNLTQAALTNKAGLPASSFITSEEILE